MDDAGLEWVGRDAVLFGSRGVVAVRFGINPEWVNEAMAVVPDRILRSRSILLTETRTDCDIESLMVGGATV